MPSRAEPSRSAKAELYQSTSWNRYIPPWNDNRRYQETPDNMGTILKKKKNYNKNKQHQKEFNQPIKLLAKRYEDTINDLLYQGANHSNIQK